MRAQDGQLGIALVGSGFMGTAHSQGWRTAPRVFELPLNPVMRVLCDRNPHSAKSAAERLGWAEAETDWHDVLDRADVDVVDICTPGEAHAEIAVAALEAGKHVLCEKPLANTLDEAVMMARLADRALSRGVHSMVGFNYRRVPALALARELIAGGRVGTVRQVRAAYLQDWLTDPDYPLSWRLQRDRAGSGAFGDLCSHIVDLAHFLLDDELTGVTALMETFVHERPLPQQSGGRTRGPVTVDDCAVFSGRFSRGAIGTFEGPESLPAERTHSGSKSTDRMGAWRSIWSRSTSSGTTTAARPPNRRDSGGYSSPNPLIPTSPHGGRQATRLVGSTRSVTRSPILSGRSERAKTRVHPSQTACACNRCW